MAGQIAWLDGTPRWRDGRVAWQAGGDAVVPGAGELALAQRRLYQIARRPRAAARALGDPATWLAARQARLELAKRLRGLTLPRPGPAAASEAALSELLWAEALCLDDLPLSPAAELVARGAGARRHLLALLDDRTAPAAVAGLAALVLGAVDRAAGGPAPALAADRALFEAVFQAAMAHGIDEPWSQIEASRRLLDRLPALRAAVARLYSRQPRHCAALLARLGRASSLREAALGPLDRLEPAVDEVPGGRLHVRLERDPILILQTGNYF